MSSSTLCVETGLQACGQTRVASDNCADFSAQNIVQLAGGAPFSHAANEVKVKSSSQSHSVRFTYHHGALKNPKPAGKFRISVLYD